MIRVADTQPLLIPVLAMVVQEAQPSATLWAQYQRTRKMTAHTDMMRQTLLERVTAWVRLLKEAVNQIIM
jgi:hypothetical protein